ncbi:hypothetical protein B0T19DRAFT_440986 [Cercophora scortea]|uniref:Zn(2)-C6 fungal-type domain-containing protein n=1 Tax=Cercophora scortea TaxID=314031 RepID=A0AAE0IKT9_9PEZI|nr:hypothetical protein B0T19DRAFT_440986 [Cercophora scortea]
MTEQQQQQQQLDSDTTPQRKRIAVACGRCRKRKIRCSGDPGQGHPCSNCKNAGIEECLFLRVSSREAPMLTSNDFGYSVSDARLYANRSPSINSGMHYGQDMPAMGSGDVMGAYRSATAYTNRPYYPATSGYGPYGDEYDYSLSIASQPVLNQHDPAASLLPGHWSRGPKQSAAAAYGNVYVDAASDPSSYGYGNTSLVHRPHAATPHTITTDEPAFSFSSVAASLPSTPSTDRLLPNPASRSSSLPYPAAIVKAPTSTPLVSSSSSASTATSLSDGTTAATYTHGGYDTPGLAYTSPTNTAMAVPNTTGTTVSSSSSSRANSLADATYSTANSTSASTSTARGESIFGEQERSLQSQGPGFDMTTYTAEARRGSAASSSGARHHHHHHSHLTGGYGATADPMSPTGSHHHRHHGVHSRSHGHRSGHGGAADSSSAAAGGSGNTAHADAHRTAVGSRH